MQAKSEPIIWPNFFTSMFQVRVRFEERMNVLHSERTVENSKFTVALQPKTSRGEHNNANAKTASRGFYLWSGKRGAFHFHLDTFDSIFFSLQNSFALWGVRPHHSLFSKRKKFNFLLPPQNILALPFLSQKRNECFPNVSSHLLAHDLPSQQRIVVQTVEGSFQKFLFVNNGMRLKGKSLQRIEEKNKV